MKTNTIVPWKATAIQVCYYNELLKGKDDDAFIIKIKHDDEEGKNYVSFKDIDKISISVDEVINLIKDAEQRLSMSNPTEDNP